MEPMATPPLSTEEYRIEVERELALAIIQKAEVNAKEYHWYGDCNGLSIALRWLGGYGDISFDMAWAKATIARLGEESEYGSCWQLFPGAKYDITQMDPPGILDALGCPVDDSARLDALAQEHARAVAAMTAHKARCAASAGTLFTVIGTVSGSLGEVTV